MKKIVIYTTLICSILLRTTQVKAQDPQFSQFYANRLYLNPAFAGASHAPRATINYRNQWPALSANYITSCASFEYFAERYNSGFGLIFMNDTQFSNLKSVDIGLQYAYQLQLNEDNFIRFGLQGSHVTRSADFYNLIFNYDNNYSPVYNDPLKDNVIQKKYWDFSTGALFHNQHAWAGITVNHINRPEQSIINSTTEQLPTKFTLHAGYKFLLGNGTFTRGLGSDMDREVSFSPTILYKRQGKFDQLDLGIYFTYSPMVFGVWYRGLPIKQYQQGLNNHDALVFLLGYRADNFSFGYSFDATISSLGMGTGGSHELSISYQFEQPLSKKKSRKPNKKLTACPNL
jgi:type IX secretion system PorP/SprF family membrane protein